MKTSILVCCTVLLLGGCSTKDIESRSVKIDYERHDRALIDELVARGADVNKEHYVSYIIDCSAEIQVSQVLSAGVKIGFEDDYPSYSEKRNTWSATLSKSMKLNLDEIAANRNLLFPVLPIQGCQPIVWGAAVTS